MAAAKAPFLRGRKPIEKESSEGSTAAEDETKEISEIKQRKNLQLSLMMNLNQLLLPNHNRAEQKRL